MTLPFCDARLKSLPSESLRVKLRFAGLDGVSHAGDCAASALRTSSTCGNGTASDSSVNAATTPSIRNTCSVIRVSLVPFAVHRLPFTVYRLPFTVYRSPFTVHRLPLQLAFHLACERFERFPLLTA